MALRSMRRGMRQRAKTGWAGQHFRSPPHIGRVISYGVISAVAMGYGFAEALRGDNSPKIFFLGVFFALFALDNLRRLRAEREAHLLPRRFRCPDCGASIALSSEERKKSTFHCDSCDEDFQVDD